MIITRQKKAPWSWVGLAHLPWAAMLFASAANTVIFSLEIRKFTANPAAIASMMTLTGILTMFVGPLSNWVSDHIWTRFGRRKVFYVPAVVMQGILVLFVPFMPSLELLALNYFLMFICTSLNDPNEVLNLEIIPANQRGRAAVFNTVYVNFGLFAYNIALIGRFDDVFPGTPVRSLFNEVSGEMLIFIMFSLALLAVGLLVSLGIKEILPHHRAQLGDGFKGKITIWSLMKRLFVETFSKEWWPIYLLGIAQSMYGMSLGGMVALMYTDQWEYSPQVLGTAQGVVQLVALFVVMFLFPLADRFDKLKFYLVCLIVGMLGKFFWYAYVMLLVPGNRPSIMEIILIGEGINLLGRLAGLISFPLIYEFIPLKRVGTAAASLGLFRGLLSVVIGPVMGFWLLFYSNIFMPGAGSSVIVVLDQPAQKQTVKAIAEDWQELTGERIWVTSHAPYSLRSKETQQWEIRLRNRDSEAAQKRIEVLQSQMTDIEREQDSDRIRGREPDPQLAMRMEELLDEMRTLESQQDAAAEAFRQFLSEQLGTRLAHIDRGLRALTLNESRLALDAETAYPLSDEQVERYRVELALGLALQAGDTRMELLDENRRLVRVEVDLEQLRQVHDRPLNSPEIGARVSALLSEANLNEQWLLPVTAVAETLEKVVAGDRNSLLVPFGQVKYRPQKVDYFSSYIVMVATDFIAIGIALFLIYQERRGKIVRRGRVESDVAIAQDSAEGDDKIRVPAHMLRSIDPQVVHHADGTQTYTPGYFKTKLATTGIGAALFCFGIFWHWHPASLYFFGGQAESQIVRITEEKAGQEPVVLTTRLEVDETEDMTRNATYRYWVRFETTAGEAVETTLNYGQKLRPVHSIGDAITIAYDPENPSDVIDRGSVRTWAFGFFFMGIGLLIFIPQFWLMLKARQPIVLDQIIDFEELKKVQGGKKVPEAQP